jgi:hypothetical protein
MWRDVLRFLRATRRWALAPAMLGCVALAPLFRGAKSDDAVAANIYTLH